VDFSHYAIRLLKFASVPPSSSPPRLTLSSPLLPRLTLPSPSLRSSPSPSRLTQPSSAAAPPRRRCLELGLPRSAQHRCLTGRCLTAAVTSPKLTSHRARWCPELPLHRICPRLCFLAPVATPTPATVLPILSAQLKASSELLCVFF
jgi:hypothetical protein